MPARWTPGAGAISSATETFPGFTGVPLGQLLSRRLGIPVTVDNDVNCAAVGEGRLGAASGCPDFLCLTYGTGIGGAIVLGGRLHYGQAFARRRSGSHDPSGRRSALQLRAGWAAMKPMPPPRR